MYFGVFQPSVVSSVVDFSGDEEFNIRRRRGGGLIMILMVDHHVEEVAEAFMTFNSVDICSETMLR